MGRRYTIRRERKRKKKKKKKGEVGESPPLLVTLLYIAHFWLAYMRLFARTSTAKRSHPRTRDEGLSAERGWWPPCRALQDEINTILCKRAGLIALGKASRISGIPNKLTLNAEGSANPPLFPRRSADQGDRTGARNAGNIYRCSRNTPYPNIA